MEATRRERLEAPRWDPAEVEGRVFAAWYDSGAFDPGAEGSPDESFSIAIPPPNVTGALHLGHALNGTIQDALVRLNRMRGRNTLWVLGTDHASIAVHAVLEQELRAAGTSRHELGRDAFLERAWAWKQEYGSRIVEQLKRLGASCDYEHERFTLDADYVRAVYRVFVRLFEQGHIYRDNYIVNWDVGSRSVISELEVESREVTDTMYWIEYPLEGGDETLTIATVRPETMLADTAVAVHPDDQRHGRLIGGHCTLPLVGRRLPIVADAHVDPEFGTGALKITPGHDPTDFEIGRAHGLEEIVVIGEDGRMNEAAGERFAGLAAAEARAAVVEALRAEGRIADQRDYVHAVPFSHRSGERIEPLISLQWFCRMDELAAPAIDVVERDQVRITPAQHKRVYLEWMRNIRPWCISRQLWWGHRLPVFYCDPCEETYVAESPPESCGLCGGELRQDPDVLDTWFSSALWPFATLGWPDSEAPLLRAYYPTDILVTARDILFLWVARMVMMGLEFVGQIPFEDVYITSIIQAPDGRRMSKSLGTGIDPLEEIDAHGADALRFGLLAMSSTQDVRFSADRVAQGRDLANKIWQAAKLIILNTEGARPAARPERVEDRWMLSRLERTVESVSADLDRYDMAHATLGFYSFFYAEFCDWYLEIVKPRLYDGDADAAANLLYALERMLALIHPVMPFVTEEIWGCLPERDRLLLTSAYPRARPELVDEAAERELEDAIGLVRGVRRWRDLVGAPVGAVLPARGGSERQPEFVARLARLALDAPRGEVLAAVGPIEILASAEIDVEQARARVGAERRRLGAEIARLERKLDTSGFVAKAPVEVVDAEREKLAGYRAELGELAEGQVGS